MARGDDPEADDDIVPGPLEGEAEGLEDEDEEPDVDEDDPDGPETPMKDPLIVDI
jgi:hypothetical protein